MLIKRNADFDGDTISLQLVPEEAAEETYRRMSPRYRPKYKKNNQLIYRFQHEALKKFYIRGLHHIFPQESIVEETYTLTAGNSKT